MDGNGWILVFLSFRLYGIQLENARPKLSDLLKNARQTKGRCSFFFPCLSL